MGTGASLDRGGTQDILTQGASQDNVSSAINRILEDVADISEEEEEEDNVIGNGEEKDSVEESAAGPDLTSDPESDDDKTKEEEVEGGVKVSKMRKRRTMRSLRRKMKTMSILV